MSAILPWGKLLLGNIVGGVFSDHENFYKKFLREYMWCRKSCYICMCRSFGLFPHMPNNESPGTSPGFLLL